MNEKRNKIAIKGLIVAVLIFVLLIPTYMINNLVEERAKRQEEAFKEVSSKWAEKQTLTGPIVSIPYLDKDSTNLTVLTKKYIHILPEKLKIDGKIIPEKRYRGLYEIVIYGAEIKFEGNFTNLINNNSHINKSNILFDQACVTIGVSDLRGIKDQVSFDWNDKTYSFNSGVETNDIISSGISTRIILDTSGIANDLYKFYFEINLKGSQQLNFTPIGKETTVNMTSNWNTPSFDGAFLPDKRDINTSGFNASWKILHLNRNYPQSWLNNSFSVNNSAFGINLLLPIDNYTKTDRSIKYAILFIALTFLIFFFLELLNNKSVHPLQYILIGFALCLFYVLLLSISEHINYTLSYIIASVMTIGLITWYSLSILHDKKLSFLVGGNLVLLYSFIFTIIQLEDFSLLMGSIGLFLILALVMYFSKKINWKELTDN